MAVYQVENVGDFVADTLKDLGKPNFTDLSSSLQHHVCMRKLFKKERHEVTSGSGIQFNVMVNHSNSARNVSLNEPDNVNTTDGMVQASTVWRQTQTSYEVIKQLMTLNREPARIVDYIKTQRLRAMIALAELFESNFWAAPSSSDTKTPLGIPYWITKNATNGFTGTVLSGYSTVASLSPTTYSGWRNWAGAYSLVSKDDFVRKAREMCTKTQFEPPIDGIPQPASGNARHGYYTNYSVVQALEEELEAQNENLGPDVASQDGKTIFRRVLVTWVPWLDRDTTNPFYQIDWDWMKLYIASGWWLKESNNPTPFQHNSISYFVDCMYQFVTRNRRCHGVLSTGTTYPS